MEPLESRRFSTHFCLLPCFWHHIASSQSKVVILQKNFFSLCTCNRYYQCYHIYEFITLANLVTNPSSTFGFEICMKMENKYSCVIVKPFFQRLYWDLKMKKHRRNIEGWLKLILYTILYFYSCIRCPWETIIQGKYLSTAEFLHFNCTVTNLGDAFSLLLLHCVWYFF